MLIYIFTYLLSILFIVVGYLINKEQKILKISFIMVGILIPCLLAAFRDVSIGTDTSRYILNLFNVAKKSEDLKTFFLYSSWYFDIKDYGYLITTYISAKVFNSFHILLFLIELLVIVPIVISLFTSKKSKSEVIAGMSIFYFFMYNVTFNMARQSIALAFIVLGISLLLNNKKKLSLFVLIIALLFHKTAIIMILIYIIYYIMNSKKIQFSRRNMRNIIYVLSILLVLNYKNIIYFLVSKNIYSHGGLYLELYSKLDFSFADLIVYAFMIFMMIINKKNILSKKIDYDFYLFMAIEAIIILQLGAFVQYLERLSLYLIYPVIFSVVPNIGDKNKIGKILLYSFLIIYWIYTFVILNSHNTMPYYFSN